MIHFFKLIRLPNLLIIALVQYVMRWGIIFPILKVNDFELQFGELNFLFLVLSTVFLTAAGYIINDYFDAKTDLINRPDQLVVGRYIERRTAIILHTIFSILGVGLGIYISVFIKIYQLAIGYVLASGLLFYYSSTYKRQFLIGNFIAALLTATIPLLTVVYEIPLLNATYRNFLLENNTNFYQLFFWVLGFSYFAFLTTFLHEIVKDIRDYEGDSAFGRNSFPIVIGVFPTKIVIFVINILMLTSLGFVYFQYLKDSLSAIYLSIGFLLPLILFSYRILRANSKYDYQFANFILKILMFFGIGYAGVVYYTLIYSF